MLQPLCSLKAGDCFEYLHDYYILTDERNKVQEEIDAVNLETGEVNSFTYNASVFKLEGVITLKRIGEET